MDPLMFIMQDWVIYYLGATYLAMGVAQIYSATDSTNGDVALITAPVSTPVLGVVGVVVMLNRIVNKVINSISRMSTNRKYKLSGSHGERYNSYIELFKYIPYSEWCCMRDALVITDRAWVDLGVFPDSISTIRVCGANIRTLKQTQVLPNLVTLTLNSIKAEFVIDKEYLPALTQYTHRDGGGRVLNLENVPESLTMVDITTGVVEEVKFPTELHIEHMMLDSNNIQELVTTGTSKPLRYLSLTGNPLETLTDNLGLLNYRHIDLRQTSQSQRPTYSLGGDNVDIVRVSVYG